MKTSGFIIFFLALISDQATKYWVSSQISVGQSIPLIRGILQITYVENPGGAFGVLPYRREFLITTTLLLMAVLFYYWRIIHARRRASWNALALIFAGAFGNLFDRLFNGAVIDFIDIGVWPIFNLADFFIVIGLGVFFYQSSKIHRERSRE